MSKIQYTFNGASFYRVISGNDATWFPKSVQFVPEAVLKDDGSGGEFLFVGSSKLDGELTIRAFCETSTDRDTLVSSVGDTSTLNNTLSSTTALLTSAKIEHRIGPYYPVLLVFKAVNN
jgi:hypothetical protein